MFPPNTTSQYIQVYGKHDFCLLRTPTSELKDIFYGGSDSAAAIPILSYFKLSHNHGVIAIVDLYVCYKVYWSYPSNPSEV